MLRTFLCQFNVVLLKLLWMWDYSFVTTSELDSSRLLQLSWPWLNLVLKCFWGETHHFSHLSRQRWPFGFHFCCCCSTSSKIYLMTHNGTINMPKGWLCQRTKRTTTSCNTVVREASGCISVCLQNICGQMCPRPLQQVVKVIGSQSILLVDYTYIKLYNTILDTHI